MLVNVIDLNLLQQCHNVVTNKKYETFTDHEVTTSKYHLMNNGERLSLKNTGKAYFSVE
jgi:hypothetical protein